MKPLERVLSICRWFGVPATDQGGIIAIEKDYLRLRVAAMSDFLLVNVGVYSETGQLFWVGFFPLSDEEFSEFLQNALPKTATTGS